ncbi:hypothetical protein KFK09_016916 [Dendrobium nobile]|uniref:Uncharacterized protein n=1 Tax=Dendrobium nobile TaxID=94219 RepID=A0A8T3B0V9_DENNO|nr:hypothetical protein KFK09_016916 [Dendrobium nobile]
MSNKRVRPTFRSVYGRPESDVEFVSSMTGGSGMRRRPALVDSYSCRQMYLRSYTFSTEKKESITEKTKRCLEKVRDHAGASLRALPRHRRRRPVRRIWIGDMKKTTKDCAAAVKRIRSVSLSAVHYVFRRLLSCTTTVEVAAGVGSKG